MSKIYTVCGELSLTSKPPKEDLERIARILPNWNTVPDEEIAWVKNTLNIQAMNRACEHLLGEQDFSAFRGSGCQSLSPSRNVESARVYESGQLVVFEVTANAFVLHMVRNIVGSLIEIGLQRQESAWIGELLKGRDRRKSAPTASPCGIYLVDVRYPELHNLPKSPRGPVFLNNNLAGGV